MPFLRVSTLKQRMHGVALASVVTLATWPAAHSAGLGNQVLGHWRVTAVLDAAAVVALDERDAQKLVGQELTIERSGLRFARRTCQPPPLIRTSVNPTNYLRENAHASAAKLGLPDPVDVVDLGCTEVFIKNPQRLVVFWKGWFFDVVKVRER